MTARIPIALTTEGLPLVLGCTHARTCIHARQGCSTPECAGVVKVVTPDGIAYCSDCALAWYRRMRGGR